MFQQLDPPNDSTPPFDAARPWQGPPDEGDLPVTRALWDAARSEKGRTFPGGVITAVAELERRLIAVEAQLGIEDSQPGDNTPPAAT